MKHGEAPWFLIWSSGLLFAFGMVWAWLVDIYLAQIVIVTVLDTPVRSALLVGAGALGTILGQLGMLLTWRHYVRSTQEAATCQAASEIVAHASPVAPSATSREAEHRRAPSSP